MLIFSKIIIVHYDTCDLSGPLLHGVKLPTGSDGRTIRLILFLLNFIVTVTVRLQLWEPYKIHLKH